jgi:hypothetical protein
MTLHPGYKGVCLNPWVLQVESNNYRQIDVWLDARGSFESVSSLQRNKSAIDELM